MPSLATKGSTHFSARVGEWLMTWIVFSIGFQLLCTPGMFDDNAMFANIRHIFGQQALTVFCLASATLRGGLLIINGNMRQSPHFRAIFGFIGAFFWLQLCFGIAYSSKSAISLSIWPWFILLEGWCVYRAMSDAREADDKAKARKLQTERLKHVVATGSS